MNRAWLGAGILAVLLIAGLVIQHAMDNAHIPVSETLSQAEQEALYGDWETARSLARDAESQWKKAQNYTAAVADHSPMEEIDRLFRELRTYAAGEEQVHFAACCAQLSRLTKAVGEAHRLSLENLL